MSEARTCGARFDRIPEAAPAPRVSLAILQPKGGTILAIGGINCGEQHSECAATFSHGSEVKLDVAADPGFEFVRYTGSCAPDGATVMTEPRSCSAVFARKAAEVAPQAPRLPSGDAPPPRGQSTAVIMPEPPPNSDGGGRGGGGGEGPTASLTTMGTGTGGIPSAGESPSPRSPTTIAKEAVQKTLLAYRDAHNSMDEGNIRRVYPTIPSSIKDQFRQLKSVEMLFTGEPEYLDLNLPRGSATVVIGVKRTDILKVGRPQKPEEHRATIKLHRLGPDSDHWTIEQVRYHK